MDAADRAQEQMERDEALRRRADDRLPAVSAYHCIDCSDPIIEARRVAAPGCVRCVDCELTFEMRRW